MLHVRPIELTHTARLVRLVPAKCDVLSSAHSHSRFRFLHVLPLGFFDFISPITCTATPPRPPAAPSLSLRLQLPAHGVSDGHS